MDVGHTKFLSDLSDAVTEGELLGPHTLFGLGGPARWFVRPHSLEQLARVVRRCGEEGVPRYMLGLGANLLVSDDGVDGVVVRLNRPLFRDVCWEAGTTSDGETLVRAGAGADMNSLALNAVRRGLAGLECMAGIPGTLGGIIRMNAGGRFGQISDVVRDVSVVSADGRVETLSKEQVGFRYRQTGLNGAVVCGATLGLRPTDPAPLRQRFLELWEYKRSSQPLRDMSAGCVFKNPPGSSAGALIEQAGLKGRSVGGAVVSPLHANFIVVKEGATAGDVFALIEVIRRNVARRSGIELELEIEVWGHEWACLAEPVA